MFSLMFSANSRFASLLLEWCRDGRQTDSGTQAWCIMTHEEIGGCSGTTRETVSLNLMDLKNHGLAESRDVDLIILSRVALANYAAKESVPDLQESTSCLNQC